VKARSKFSCIGHNGGLTKAMFVQCASNSADPAIHHIGRCYNVSSCPGMRESHACEKVQRCVILNIAVSDNTAMPMAGILAEADISDHQHFRYFSFDTANGLLDNTLLGIGL